jgi:hypothetical protein
MAGNEKTSARIASIAARGARDPASLTLREIQAVCASAMTQAPDGEIVEKRSTRFGELRDMLVGRG